MYGSARFRKVQFKGFERGHPSQDFLFRSALGETKRRAADYERSGVAKTVKRSSVSRSKIREFKEDKKSNQRIGSSSIKFRDAMTGFDT